MDNKIQKVEEALRLIGKSPKLLYFPSSLSKLFSPPKPFKTHKQVTEIHDAIIAWGHRIKSETKQEFNNSLAELMKKRKAINLIDARVGIITKPMKGAQKSYRIVPDEFGFDKYDVPRFLNESEPLVNTIIKNNIANKAAKVVTVMKLLADKPNGLPGQTQIFHVWSDNLQRSRGVYTVEQTEQFVQGMNANMIRNCEEFEVTVGSGWRIQAILEYYINISKYSPVSGSSFIELPAFLKKCKSRFCINVKNNDNKCFLYAILSLLYPAETNPNRASNYDKYITKDKKGVITSVEGVNIPEGVKFPIEINAIKNFEKINDFKINVYNHVEEDAQQGKPCIRPLYVSEFPNKSKQLNLLLICNGDNTKKHYVAIKDFSGLCALENCHRKKYYCYRCVHGFSRQDLLDEHIKNVCPMDREAAAVSLPKLGENFIEFNNAKATTKLPYVIYADFESILKPIEKQCGDSTTLIQEHVDCSYCFKVVATNKDEYYPSEMYCGEDAAFKMIERLLKLSEELVQKMIVNIPMKMTAQNINEYYSCQNCHICQKALNGDKVRDHDHLTGDFIGAAHNACNLNRHLFKMKIPVIFHNLKGYDAHHIVKQLGRFEKSVISVIPNTSEKYMSFSINGLKFVDSLNFLSASLGKLVDNLDKDKFNNMHDEFKDTDTKLLLQKGIYPYDYMDSFEKFNSQLPTKDDFYSRMNDEHISDEDYLHVKNVWDTFNCTTMQNYHDLYLKTDVLLLADVFESFRDMSLESYELDPLHYISLPGLSWDACLKKTKARLELFHEEQLDMHLMVEKGIRGGISMISHRYSKANNKYMSNYDNTKESKYIWYGDSNNLYGFSMTQYLPYDNFKWVDGSSFNDESILSISDTNDEGYIFEVDLEYPDNLHESHNDYPLAPESLCVTSDMLSEYATGLKNKLNIKESNKVKKLVPNLRNKTKYIVHYRNLKLYLSLGLRLTNIHRVLSFNQKPWLAEYINFNTTKRAQCKNDFEKDFYKLMNNAVFGKTMENVRNRINFKIVNNEKSYMRLSNSPLFKHAIEYDGNEDDPFLKGVHMMKDNVELNKPISIGFSILDLSKVLMYDFHYNTMRKTYGDKCKLLFTDTDSLCYEIKTEDLYTDMMHIKDQLDTSEYDKNHILYDTKNKKVVGKFKDEAMGEIIEEFVGIKAKCYSYKINDEEHKKLKGIKRTVVKNSISHEDYKRCIFSTEIEQQQQHHHMKTIRSMNHNLFTVDINKVSLSAFDNKRYLIDNINSYAYGHKNISGMIKNE